MKNVSIIGAKVDGDEHVGILLGNAKQVTINGVTYQITNTSNPTVTISALPGEDSDVTGHKQATILATIPKNHTALVADSYAWEAYGFTFTSEATGEMIVSSDNISSLDFSTLGNSVGNYGYLTVLNNDIYTTLAGLDAQSQASLEGYKIRTYRGGYFALNNGTGYAMAEKNKTISQSGITDILSAAGMSGGAIAFKDLAGTALPAGTGDYADKLMAAAGQTVVVEVTLPTGFEFTSDDCKMLKVNDGTTDQLIPLSDTDADGTWTAEFTMPSTATTISFNEASPLQGKTLSTFNATVPTEDADKGTIEAAPGNPSPIHVGDNVTYHITPATPGSADAVGYELTGLSLMAGETAVAATYTIKDATNDVVTLPTTSDVNVTFAVPITNADEMTFKPIFGNPYKTVTFPANYSTYFDNVGLALHEANDNLKFYTISSVVNGTNATTATLTEITSKKIPTGTPVIVYNTTGASATVRMDLGTYDAVTVASQFKGTAEAKALNAEGNGPWNMADNTDYYGFNGSDFIWIKEAGNVAAHRCWIEITTSAARQLTLVWPDGTATRIQGVSADDEDGDWYDLNGRKHQAKPKEKGVYILNGQKKVVK